MPKAQCDETDLFIPYLCDRCHNPLEGGGLCSVCRRRLVPTANHGQPNRSRFDDEMTPWQENAIRILEDLE